MLTLSGCVVLAQPAPPARAGAWTMPEGDGQAILSVERYTTSIRPLASGARSPGDYHSSTATFYTQYGLTDAQTIGGSLEAVRVEKNFDFGANDTTDTRFSRGSLFTRQRLWTNGWTVVSIESTGTVTHGETGQFANVDDSYDLDTRLLFGHSFEARLGSGFINLEGGYRLRVGPPADEAHLDLTAGWKPGDHWMLLLQSFNTIGMRNAQPGGDDYDVYKIQPGVAYHVAGFGWLYSGAYFEVAGRNLELGDALVAGTWVDF